MTPLVDAFIKALGLIYLFYVMLGIIFVAGIVTLVGAVILALEPPLDKRNE